MARPVSAQYDQRRDEILNLAAALFAKEGFSSASMAGLAAACGMSKALLYHYYTNKEAILFDLLDRYTQRLLAIIGQTEGAAQRKKLSERAALHELVRNYLVEYEHSASRHVALLNDTKFLGDAQRELIVQRQRDVVLAFTRFLRRAYPDAITDANERAKTMMLFGMINWTFTWLKTGGTMSYRDFAEEVCATLESGFAAPAAKR
jgi:AcrR family transcriptional regulator